MDAGLGIVVALAALLVADMIEGGSPAAFANLSALMIILGGTFGATIASAGLAQFKAFPKLFTLALKPRVSEMAATSDRLVHFAERARREGLLALESDVDQVEDPFLRRGLQMVIDGLEPETVEEVLETEIEATQARHGKGIAMFAQMGGFAPTMGVIGTVMGLVNVLSHLDDPSNLGRSIAVAFIATLIGVGTANIAWLPISNNLKRKDAEEAAERRMVLAAILAIQAGDNPRIVARKLQAHARPVAAAPATSSSSASAPTAAPGAAEEAA
ncbi:MAG TPA: flagellar motor protein [Candidatus Limnocylindrales bacterium]